jgi:hypothetical protein
MRADISRVEIEGKRNEHHHIEPARREGEQRLREGRPVMALVSTAPTTEMMSAMAKPATPSPRILKSSPEEKS